MQRSTRFPVLMLAAVAVIMSCGQALAGGLELQSGGKLWLEGKSTIHEFRSSTSSVKATFGQNEALWPAHASGGDAIERFVRAKGVTSMEVVVVVTELRSGKIGLDKNMYKALLAPKYPEIRFRMARYVVTDGATPGEIAIDARGAISVAGVEREIRMPVTAVREGESLRLQGSAPLLMSQFGVKPPTMMMGAVRTSDEIVVHFDLLIGAKDATSGVSKAE